MPQINSVKEPNSCGSPRLVDSSLPLRVDRRRGASIVTERFFPVSHRTLETWPITWRLVNGRATCDTLELVAVAQEKLAAAPSLKGGKQRYQATKITIVE